MTKSLTKIGLMSPNKKKRIQININYYNNNYNSISDRLSLLKSKLDEMNVTLSNTKGNNIRIINSRNNFLEEIKLN